MADISIVLTDREAQLVRVALRYLIEERGTYRSWINDEPMLPAKREAIDKIEAEERECWGILAKILHEPPATRAERETKERERG